MFQKNPQKVIIEKIKNGDHEAFKWLVNQLYPTLVAQARAMVGMPDAKDIALESLVKYWVRRESFDEIDAIRAFLYAVVKNACLDELKRRAHVSKMRAELLKEHGEQDLRLVKDDNDFKALVIKEIHEEISRLPTETAIVVKMHLAGKMTGEISESLVKSPQTVRNQKIRAFKRIRDVLTNRGFKLLVILSWLPVPV